MKTAHPTTERILAQFKEINCLIEEVNGQAIGRILGKLTPLQERILVLLGVSPKIYELSFERHTDELL